ncbi:UNVERIFIED_CONTAM: hypothetical protein Sradi_7010300 [Sesamum radiatum]|uniref:Uncharacterized protein n=1 Tax=Sesamum radiatum TaxID=300843 RepID=A0AAW2JC42_SESRA
MVNGVSEDLSPISIRCLSNYYHPNGLMPFGTNIRKGLLGLVPFAIGGLGYRLLVGLITSGPTTERRLAMWFRTLLPLTIWLGRGRPLNPYLRSYLIQFLLQEWKPKDLKVVPNEYFEQPGRKDFLEWSLLRCWMEVKIASLVLHYCNGPMGFYRGSPRGGTCRNHSLEL